MKRTTKRTSAVLIPLAALSLSAVGGGSAPVAAPAPAQNAAQAPEKPGLMIYSAGIDAILVDEKDRGLRDALHLLDDRLVELPGELGQGIPPDAFGLPVQALLGPFALRAGYRGMDLGDKALYAQLELLLGSPEKAQAFEDKLGALTQGMLPPGEVQPNGLLRLPQDGPFPVHHGVLGDRFLVSVGEVLAAAPTFENTGLPPGVQPNVAFRMDFGQYMHAIEDFVGLSMGSDEMAFLEMFSLGELTTELVAGAGTDRSYHVSRMPGYAGYLASTTGMPAARIGRETLRLIPRDAVVAQASVVDLAGTVDFIVEMLTSNPEIARELGGQDPIETLFQMTGVHLRSDIVAHLGQRMGYYVADSTGGGGVSSIVVFADVVDVAGLTAGLANLAESLNGMGDMAARGYVEMRDWTSGDQKLTTLTFPGLPIPLEPTFAIHDGWIFKGLTPQAVLGAIDQAKGKTSLLDNAAMTEMASGPLEDLMSFGWLDAPALLSDGYGWTAALGAMLSNGVRSPRDSSRGAGLIVPPFNRLAAGAKPTVLLGRMVGADLVATGQTDRSVLVNATAMFGVIDRFAVLLVPFVFAGAAIPARMAQRYGSQNDHGYYDEWEELDDMGYLDDVGYGEDTGYGGDEDGGGDDDDDDGGGGGGGGGDDEDGR